MKIISRCAEQPVVAAIVVGYFPDTDILTSLLLSLTKQVNHLFLIDNGGCEVLNLSTFPRCKYIRLDSNYGLGFALNAGFSLAVAEGAEYVATFDQDSIPPDNLIAALLDQNRVLNTQGISCAAIGPVIFDRREANAVYFPFFKEINNKISVITPSQSSPAAIEVDVLITSGMLVASRAWADCLNYDEKMFLDYTDTDWCFRARNKGYRLFACPTIQMGHAMSDAPPIRILGLNFFKYSALRRYYYFRNTILFVKKSYVSFAWKRRLLMGLVPRVFGSIFYENEPMTQLAMICKGLWSGVKNRAGAYQP